MVINLAHFENVPNTRGCHKPLVIDTYYPQETAILFSCNLHPLIVVIYLVVMMRSLFLTSLLFLANAGDVIASPTAPKCKCFPGDACWPSQKDWNRLNSDVGGRLVTTVPLGSPCHDPTYDAQKCAVLKDEWLYSSIQ